MKVSELSGPALDWVVAKTLGGTIRTENGVFLNQGDGYEYFTPSSSWSQGGPIIERYIDCIRKRSKAEEANLERPNPNFKFKAEIFSDIDGYFCGYGPTPLIAAMRCHVASKLGDGVEIPKELL